MTDHVALAREEADLVKADRDIAAGEQRIADLTGLVAQLAHDGYDTRTALLLLETFHQTLQAWRDHRELIVSRIEYLR